MVSTPPKELLIRVIFPAVIGVMTAGIEQEANGQSAVLQQKPQLVLVGRVQPLGAYNDHDDDRFHQQVKTPPPHLPAAAEPRNPEFFAGLKT